MSPPYLIFDLDDTLYPERDFALSGFRAAARWAQSELGLEGLDRDMTRLLDDGHLGALFGMALKARLPAHTEAQLAVFIEAYRTHDPVLTLYGDARAAPDHWGVLGPLGLITDGTPTLQQSKVRALRIAPCFREIVYTHGLGGRAFAKPHPAAFERMEQVFGATGSELVYVGDNPAKDFVAPNARGWITVQIVRPNRIHSAGAVADGGAARHVVSTLADLPVVLGG